MTIGTRQTIPATLSMMLKFIGIVAALATLASIGGAQSVTINPQADTLLRLFCTYRTANGDAVSSRDVSWTVRKPSVAQVVAVPGTSRMRHVFIKASVAGDSTAIICSATVSARTYRDSVFVRGASVTRILAQLGPFPLIAPPEPAPVPPPPPTTGGTPYLVEDFNAYTSTGELIASPKFAASAWDVNPQQITLDLAGGVGGTPAMRFDFPDRTTWAGRCTDWGVARLIPAPANTKKLWGEFYVKFSSNWTAVAPAAWSCTSGIDYKFVHGTVEGNALGQYGRFQINHNDAQWYLGTPNAADQWTTHPTATMATHGTNPNPAPADFYDGQFHRYRLEFKLSSTPTSTDGGIRIWVDSHLLIDKQGLVIDRPFFYGFKLGANLNQGPGQLQSITWDSMRVWTVNPGW